MYPVTFANRRAKHSLTSPRQSLKQDALPSVKEATNRDIAASDDSAKPFSRESDGVLLSYDSREGGMTAAWGARTGTAWTEGL